MATKSQRQRKRKSSVYHYRCIKEPGSCVKKRNSVSHLLLLKNIALVFWHLAIYKSHQVSIASYAFLINVSINMLYLSDIPLGAKTKGKHGVQETPPCQCKRPAEGKMGCGEDCLNRYIQSFMDGLVCVNV